MLLTSWTQGKRFWRRQTFKQIGDCGFVEWVQEDMNERLKFLIFFIEEADC